MCLLPPFEMAIREGGARSVMNSYAEIDGVPVAATPEYLTALLRDDWGFDGTVVSDYFSVAFLHTMHAVAADLGEAAGAGSHRRDRRRAAHGRRIPRARSPPPSATAASTSRSSTAAVRRVLAQKEELGLLDETFDDPPTIVDLDSPAHRASARRLAEESIVLLTNDGTLPLGERPAVASR